MRPFLVLLTLLGCNGPEEETSRDTDPDSDTDGDTDTGVPACGTAGGAVPDGLVTLAWDDGAAATELDAQSWSFGAYDGQTYVIAEEKSHEAVRFDLEHPAKVHAISVYWAGTDALADEDELEVGLYPDFGHNGFDFWRWEPYWTGTRCKGDIDADGWVTYLLDEPVQLDHPGLVHVADTRAGQGAPGFAMDGSYEGEGACATWDECHSAVNLPEIDTSVLYPGWSFPLPYDYLVRLHVEYTEELQPEEKVFQATDLEISSRASWGDYDNDGWDDLLTTGPTLYRNEGDGTFTDVTAEAGLEGAYGSGGVWGDYDNDGCLDLFLFAESYGNSDLLFHSLCDGTFEDVTETSGISDIEAGRDCDGNGVDDHAPTPAAAWWDIDGDGLLDLFLSNFICWNDWTYYRDATFRNNGDGTFADWSGENGFLSSKTSGRGAHPVDHDQDGHVDLLVNNYTLNRNLFFRNNGDGTVDEVASTLGLAGNKDWAGGSTYYYGHTIGAAWGDLDGDGDFDTVHANLAHPRFFDFSDKTQVLLQEGGTYSDNAGEWDDPWPDNGLRYSETHSVPVLADFDHDGALDLVITAVYDGRPTDFYWGVGDGTFRLDTYTTGITTENGWGAAYSDFDHDGDADLVTYTLFENTSASSGNWLQVRAIGNVDSNWAALGATVRVEAGDRVFLRHVPGGTGQGCQDSMYLHFGLGENETIDRIEVDFPASGTVSYEGPFDADQRLWLYEDGTTASGWDWPE